MHRQQILVISLAVILASSLLLFFRPERPPTVSANEEYAWQQIESGTTKDLLDVDMLSSDDGWAVGANTFLHWDGTTWSFGSTTASGVYEGLGMVSSSDGWAVGLDGKIARWDGTSWKDFATHPDEVWFWDVDMLSASDGWIVGDDGTILRWNGSSWSTEPSPVDFRLMKVRAVSANEAWIAGFDFDTGNGVILRWDGTEWITQTIPQTGRLFDIAMPSPSEAWAVGENGVVLHWANGVWDEWKNPTSEKSQQNQILWLMGIDMLSPTLGWFVGGYIDFSFIAKWDGTSWISEESPSNSFLQAVDMLSPTDGWAVGYNGTILQYALVETATPTHTTTPTPTATPTLMPTPGSSSTPMPDEWKTNLPVVLNPIATNKE